jgi:hypothetical protein
MEKSCLTLVLNKIIPCFPYWLACTLLNLKHIWMRSMGIFYVYLAQWLPFFCMLTMMLYFLYLEHAHKDFKQAE